MLVVFLCKEGNLLFLLSFEKRMDLDRVRMKAVVTFLSAHAKILYLIINEMHNLKTIKYSAML
jgi:hypothetical protein